MVIEPNKRESVESGGGKSTFRARIDGDVVVKDPMEGLNRKAPGSLARS
jgi:hypothetical protein